MKRYGHDIAMKRRRLNWSGIKYQPPGDDIKKLMKDHWAVPFWGIRESGPTGLVFFKQADADVFLSGDSPAKKLKLKAVLFDMHATKLEKRDWLADLGVSAVREDCSRTKIGYTLEWVPLLRQGRKPFGLIPNMVCDDSVKEFYVLDADFEAHVFGDGFTLAQRREYAKGLGADIGLVEPLKGKSKEKGSF